MMRSNYSRRNFLKRSTAGVLGLGMSGLSFGASKDEWAAMLEELLESPPQTGKSVIGLKSKKIKPVRVGFIGLVTSLLALKKVF